MEGEGKARRLSEGFPLHTLPKGNDKYFICSSCHKTVIFRMKFLRAGSSTGLKFVLSHRTLLKDSQCFSLGVSGFPLCRAGAEC